MLESETKLYLQQIGQYPLLSPEQEEELVKNKRPGWRNTLINSNLRLVVSIAKVYARNTKVALLDLIQAGNIGLCLAADRFELGHGAKFSTYATWWIKQSINK
jgi:RNA polymerase primary sigma factor